MPTGCSVPVAEAKYMMLIGCSVPAAEAKYMMLIGCSVPVAEAEVHDGQGLHLLLAHRPP